MLHIRSVARSRCDDADRLSAPCPATTYAKLSIAQHVFKGAHRLSSRRIGVRKQKPDYFYTTIAQVTPGFCGEFPTHKHRLTTLTSSVLLLRMNNGDYRFAGYTFSHVTGLSEGKRHIRMPRRLVVLLQILLEANGEAIDVEALQNFYSQRSKHPQAAKISLSQNIFWLRRHLKDGDGAIVQTVLKKGYRIGVPVVRSDTPPATARHATSLSGEMAAEAATASLPVGSGTARDPADSAPLTLATESSGAVAVAYLAPEVVINKSITGSIRLADHAGQAIDSLGKRADSEAGSSADLAMLGWLKGAARGELDEGLSLVDRALDLSPKLGSAHFYRAWLLMASRRIDQALRQLERGLTLDARNDSLMFLKSWAFCAMGRHKELDALTEKALAIYPNHLMLRVIRSIGVALQGQLKRAESLMAQTAMLFPQRTILVAMLAWLRALQGDSKTSLTLLTGHQKLANGYMPPISIAAVYSVMGDRSAASAYLGFANVDQDPWRQLVWCDPRFTMLDKPDGASLSVDRPIPDR